MYNNNLKKDELLTVITACIKIAGDYLLFLFCT